MAHRMKKMVSAQTPVAATGQAGESQQHRVKVVVRVRPALNSDDLWVLAKNNKTLVTVNHKNLDETVQYEFEAVYGPESSQLAIYNSCVSSLLRHPLNGQNASVFAYGPTGAGKTHTILGTVEDPGIIPRCIKGLFSLIEEEKTMLHGWDILVSFSYLEIYNEKVLDLLDPTNTDLSIREDCRKNIFVAGAFEKDIGDVHEFNASFGPASKNRLVESGAINTSLLALSEVVDALNQQAKKGQSHIPYRRSKLTRLLQDSLGGSAHSLMIVNLSPEEEHCFETYSTLHFARKTRKIINTAKTHETLEKATPQQRLKRLCGGGLDTPPPAKTPKNHITAAPFLSPLLRNQKQFEHDVCERLQLLEDRLMEQMSVTILNATSSFSVSTLANGDLPSTFVTKPTPENISPGTSSDATIDKLAHKLENLKGQKTNEDKEGDSLLDVSLGDTPLFLNTKPIIHRKTKKCRLPPFQLSSASTEKENQPSESFNPELQKAHNTRVLKVLNSGSVKELQSLQTVGDKRARTIQDWRKLHGAFKHLGDLKNVPGFSSRYVTSFLRANLVQLNDAL